MVSGMKSQSIKRFAVFFVVDQVSEYWRYEDPSESAQLLTRLTGNYILVITG